MLRYIFLFATWFATSAQADEALFFRTPYPPENIQKVDYCTRLDQQHKFYQNLNVADFDRIIAKVDAETTRQLNGLYPGAAAIKREAMSNTHRWIKFIISGYVLLRWYEFTALEIELHIVFRDGYRKRSYKLDHILRILRAPCQNDTNMVG